MDKPPQHQSVGQRSPTPPSSTPERYFSVPFLQHLGRIWKLACQHRVLPGMQRLPVFTFRMQEDTTQGWFPQAAWQLHGQGQACVTSLRCHQAGWPGLLPSKGFTRLFSRQQGLPTAHLWAESPKSSLTAAPLRQVCGAMEGGHRADPHAGVGQPLLPRPALTVTSTVNRTGASQAREVV